MHAYAKSMSTTVVVDLTRDHMTTMKYGVLEAWKNGVAFIDKYSSSMLWIPKQLKIIVMMNEDPDKSKLSHDRYQVLTIEKTRPSSNGSAHLPRQVQTRHRHCLQPRCGGQTWTKTNQRYPRPTRACSTRIKVESGSVCGPVWPRGKALGW